VRDSTYVLDGLLYHESDLRIEEHYTDTAGFTDHAFALMHLLGFRFAPRIRDLGDTKLYVPSRETDYPALKAMIGGTLNIKHLRAHWDEVLRLATSIKQGTVTASLMLRKLGSYPRQNGLAIALREFGRIERTLFILNWLQNVELRRRVHAGLNKGEARNALARAVFFNRLGEIRNGIRILSISLIFFASDSSFFVRASGSASSSRACQSIRSALSCQSRSYVLSPLRPLAPLVKAHDEERVGCQNDYSGSARYGLDR
jgi:TnpA family transposase